MGTPASSTGSTHSTPQSGPSRAVNRLSAHRKLRVAFLASGVVSAVWWIAADIVGSLRYPGYSYRDQTISELSAIGAPTRSFMTIVSGVPYAMSMVAFGTGVWVSGGRTVLGRAVGALLVVEALFGVIGGILFPMARREVMAAGGETLRNRLHMPYGLGMPLLFVTVTACGSRMFGMRFRWYSYGTIVVSLVSGFMAGLQSGRMRANEPTPWLGVVERMTAYTPMLWIIVLAVGLLRQERQESLQAQDHCGGHERRVPS